MRAVLALLALAGCKSSASSTEVPAPGPVDAHIATAFQRVGGQFAVSGLALDGVRSDGALDPARGRLRVETGRLRGADRERSSQEIVDEITAQCPLFEWTAAGERTHYDRGCLTPYVIERPRCTLRQVWQRAIADGAPADALARIRITALVVPQQWIFDIEGRFKQSYDDDCVRRAEQP